MGESSRSSAKGTKDVEGDGDKGALQINRSYLIGFLHTFRSEEFKQNLTTKNSTSSI